MQNFEGEKSNIVVEDWQSSGTLRVLSSGIDFLINTNNRTFHHEDHCFWEISKRVGNKIAIGPHIIDYLLQGRIRDDNGEEISRPDAFIFDPNDHNWTLTGLVEIKSSKLKRDALLGKIRGFRKMLDYFRLNYRFLPREINQIIGDCLEIPKQIIIAPNSEIEVTFVAPFKDGIDFNWCSDLNVTFLRIPFVN
jgi:hypothetical protein